MGTGSTGSPYGPLTLRRAKVLGLALEHLHARGLRAYATAYAGRGSTERIELGPRILEHREPRW